MMTSFQQRQLEEIKKYDSKMVQELRDLGAVAEICVRHYPGRHSNLNTLRSIAKFGRSKTVVGDDPKAAVVSYARSVFGQGRLKSNGTENYSDGSFSVSYLVFS